MTEFKHTPGPWFPALLYGYMTGVRAQNPETGRWVAHAWCQTSTPASHEAHAKQVAQNEANARLIAAAPDLLEALQASYGVFDSTEIGHHMHDCECSQCAFVTTRDNAVRKAIGEDE